MKPWCEIRRLTLVTALAVGATLTAVGEDVAGLYAAETNFPSQAALCEWLGFTPVPQGRRRFCDGGVGDVLLKA